MEKTNIRQTVLSDAERICEIYNHYVNNTVISFEVTPVFPEEMERRIFDILDCENLYYVIENEEKVLGYVYLSQWLPRRAYSMTKEVSIYIDKDYSGKGLATLLYEHIFKNIDRNSVHTLISGIALPNPASVRLHEKFGFKQVSETEETGRKFGRWIDVGHWQIIL